MSNGRIRFRKLLCAALVLCLAFVRMPAKAEETNLAEVQRRLIALGYEIGAADGVLGPKTTSAVQLAQTPARIDPDAPAGECMAKTEREWSAFLEKLPAVPEKYDGAIV